MYDSYGRKTNNRESRWKERYNNEKQDVMEAIFDVDRRLLPGNFTKRKKKGKVRSTRGGKATSSKKGLLRGVDVER